MEKNEQATQTPPEVPSNVTATPPPAGSSKTRLYILLGGLGVLLLILIGYLVIQNPRLTTKPQPVVTQPTTQTPTLARSKAPGIVISVVTAKGVDPKTGEAVKPTSVFLTTDKSIYAVTTLRNAIVGTRIEYVRYLNKKFLDNRSIKITKLNVNNASFAWTLKNSTAVHPAGEYRIKVYTNGIFEKETSYVVQ